jgi:hypothetical protein
MQLCIFEPSGSADYSDRKQIKKQRKPEKELILYET